MTSEELKKLIKTGENGVVEFKRGCGAFRATSGRRTVRSQIRMAASLKLIQRKLVARARKLGERALKLGERKRSVCYDD